MTCVTTLSRKARSWLTSNTVPVYSCSSPSSSSRRLHVEIVGRLVQHQHVGASWRTAARAGAGCARRRRATSPASARAPAETGTRRDSSSRACGRRPPRCSPSPGRRCRTRSPHRRAVRGTGRSRRWRAWSRSRTRPESGAISPRMSRISVVLPAAVGPDQPDLVTAQNAAGEILHHRLAVEGLGDMRQLGDQLARSLAFLDREPDAAQALAPRGTLSPQLLPGAARGLHRACAAPPRRGGSRLPPAPARCRTFLAAVDSSASCCSLRLR